MAYIQSNTQRGPIVRNNVTQAMTTLDRGKVVLLVDNTSGESTVALPTADGVLVQYVVDDVNEPTVNHNQCAATGVASGGASGVTLIPLFMERNFRCLAVGTVSGSGLVMAASGGGVKAATGTNVWTVGAAEEEGVSGQYILIRPLIVRGTF